MAPPTAPSKNQQHNKTAQNDNDEREPMESGAKGEASKDMRNVTNYVNEELANREVNAASLSKSLRFLQDAARTHRQTSQTKTAPTSAVNKQDVEFLMNHMQISKAEAERSLREKENDVVAALNYLVEK